MSESGGNSRVMKSASVIVVFVGRPMRSSRLAFHPPGRLPLGVASASDPVFRTEPQRGLVPAIMDLEVEVPVGSLTHAGVALAWFQGALELPDPRPNDPVKYCRLEPGSDPLQDQLGADGLLLVQRPLERDLLGEAAPMADLAEIARAADATKSVLRCFEEREFHRPADLGETRPFSK